MLSPTRHVKLRDHQPDAYSGISDLLSPTRHVKLRDHHKTCKIEIPPTRPLEWNIRPVIADKTCKIERSHKTCKIEISSTRPLEWNIRLVIVLGIAEYRVLDIIQSIEMIIIFNKML